MNHMGLCCMSKAYTFLRIFLFVAFAILSVVPAYANQRAAITQAQKATLKDLKKHIKKLESFDEATSREELATFMVSFKEFAEEETGKKYSFSEMYQDFRKNAKKLSLAVNPDAMKPFFDEWAKCENKKSVSRGKTNNQKEEVINSKILLGTAYIACAPLVSAIGDQSLTFAPYCFTKATYLFAEGAHSIFEGSREK